MWRWLSAPRRAPSMVQLADEHMWSFDGGSATSRVQAFRGDRGLGIAVVTLRDGDRGPSHINAAEGYRASVWRDFYDGDGDAPVLLFNLLNPTLRMSHLPNVVEATFDSDGDFNITRGARGEHLQLLEALDVAWDEGSGFVRYLPPAPTDVAVYRRIALSELPATQPFRDLRPYVAVDWRKAVQVALTARTLQNLPTDLPIDIDAAARSLFYDPIELIRERGSSPRFMNGQHRTEALRLQGGTEVIVAEYRPIGSAALPGELGPV